jgi:uncharacterized membrane protein YtjA (UPF0391 family)
MAAKTRLTDQCVRLGMAIIVIALISLALYQFSGRAGAAANTSSISFRL